MISPRNKLPSKNIPGGRLLSLVVLAGILTAGWFVTPGNLLSLPLCLFQHVFHLDCPGCGLTRSVLMMARGQVGEAVHYNAAGPLVYFLFLSYFVEQSGRLFQDSFRIYYPVWVSRLYALSLAGLLLAHWVFKLWGARHYII